METDFNPAWVLTDDERDTIARSQVIVSQLMDGDDITPDERQELKKTAAICRGLGGAEDLWVAGFLQDILDKMVLQSA